MALHEKFSGRICEHFQDFVACCQRPRFIVLGYGSKPAPVLVLDDVVGMIIRFARQVVVAVGKQDTGEAGNPP